MGIDDVIQDVEDSENSSEDKKFDTITCPNCSGSCYKHEYGGHKCRSCGARWWMR